MSSLQNEFDRLVSRRMLEKNEPKITTDMEAGKDEIKAIKTVLNAVAIDFYMPKMHELMLSSTQQWDRIAEINSVIEEGLSDFPKSLSCFKIWVVKNIGIDILSEPGSEMLPWYPKAREVLYLDWYEREGSRMMGESS